MKVPTALKETHSQWELRASSITKAEKAKALAKYKKLLTRREELRRAFKDFESDEQEWLTRAFAASRGRCFWLHGEVCKVYTRLHRFVLSNVGSSKRPVETLSDRQLQFRLGLLGPRRKAYLEKQTTLAMQLAVAARGVMLTHGVVPVIIDGVEYIPACSVGTPCFIPRRLGEGELVYRP